MTSTNLNSTVEAGPLAEALRSLRRGLARATGFALFVGVVKTPAQSHRIIKLLAETMPGTLFQTFTIQPDTTDILAGIQRQFGGDISGPVMIVGLENALSSDIPNPPILHALNLRRPDWPALVPQPVVLWVTEFWLGELARSAPDFLDWRSDTLHFPDLEPGQLEILDAATWDGGADTKMPRAARMERIKELESLIATNEHNQDAFIRSTVAGWMNELGLHLVLLGKRREALQYFQKILSIGKELGNKTIEFIGLGNIAGVYCRLGDLRQAALVLKQALDIGAQINHKKAKINGLINLAVISLRLGDLKKGIELCEQALLVAREMCDRNAESSVLANLGIAYENSGDLQKAKELYEQSLTLRQLTGDREGESGCLGNLGNIYIRLGATSKALQFYERALNIAQEIGDRRGQGNSLGNIGMAYQALGDAKKAIELLDESLAIRVEIDDRRGEGIVQFNYASVLHSMGLLDQAITRAEVALNILEQLEDPNVSKVRAALAEWRKKTAA